MVRPSFFTSYIHPYLEHNQFADKQLMQLKIHLVTLLIFSSCLIIRAPGVMYSTGHPVLDQTNTVNDTLIHVIHMGQERLPETKLQVVINICLVRGVVFVEAVVEM